NYIELKGLLEEFSLEQFQEHSLHHGEEGGSLGADECNLKWLTAAWLTQTWRIGLEDK
ncbi:hypothetical protein STEG23_014581, partial [Scotinomys teguina]